MFIVGFKEGGRCREYSDERLTLTEHRTQYIHHIHRRCPQNPGIARFKRRAGRSAKTAAEDGFLRACPRCGPRMRTFLNSVKDRPDAKERTSSGALAPAAPDGYDYPRTKPQGEGSWVAPTTSSIPTGTYWSRS